MSSSKDKESFISLKMNVLQNLLWLSQNENCIACMSEHSFFRIEIFGLCVSSSVGSRKQQSTCPKTICIFNGLMSQLLPPSTTGRFVHRGVSTGGWALIIWHFTKLTDLDDFTHSAWCHQIVLHTGRGYFWFRNRMIAGKDGYRIATSDFVYIRQSRTCFPQWPRLLWRSPRSEAFPLSALVGAVADAESWVQLLLLGTQVTGLAPGLLHPSFLQGEAKNSLRRRAVGQLR